MGVRETQPEEDGGVAPPSVDPTPAAQPPSPRPSITGAETAHTENKPSLDGFLFSVDWLAFTVPSSTVEEVQQKLGGEWMELKKGFNGYPRAWLNVSSGGGSGRMGTGMPHRTREVHVSLSGEIVSAWESEKVQAICRWINELKGHGTRVDVALDDRTGHATVSHVIAAADAGQAVMRWRTYDAKRRCSYKGQDDIQGQMVTFGSRQSETYLRVYDKRMEAAGKGETVEGPWVRWELEFKKDRAQLCVDLFAHLPVNDWREFTVGLLKSCISFRDTTADAPAWERCRSSELPWWKALTEGFTRSRFHVETTDRKLEEVLAWFSQAMGPTLAAIYCAVGPEWITKVIQSGSSRWKPQHYQMMKKQEPKRVACGAPDFIITHGQTPLGYIEAKDVGKPLDEVENGEQMRRYLESLSNLILTDYLEFRWYVLGKHRLTARLASVGAKGKFRTEPDGAEQATELLTAFINAQVPTVGTPKELAGRMAALARLIRDIIHRAFENEDKNESLHQQMEGFRKVLLHDLTEEQFADMYAQTICYGLFAARCNAKGDEPFTRQHAAYDLPKTNPFLRKMFGHIAGPDLDERIVWAVDDLAELLNRADIAAILKDFGKHTRREDPVVHFYETFLAAYDPKMREARGIYYTPEPVVSYIVRSVDHILKSDFGLPDGLADSSKITVKNPDGKGKTDVHKVLILDPAVGTGTFLFSVIDLIHDSFKGNKGMWSSYVSQQLLPRLFGFELLMAPYAVAHMKLGLELAETGYDFKTEERLRVYLTNTLEEAHEMTGLPLFTQWLAEEANAASQVKQDIPVMVVLGNPPYSVSSQNKGDWISELLQEYKKDLKEKKLNLDDDFIKFFRFAQWGIEKTGYGILAFISNHTYLDGITHRRMRQSLMETFDDIYVLDLHGNSNKKEQCPDDLKDANVFDIKQGVAIGIFIKRKKRKGPARVRHAEFWGSRESKYARLFEQDITATEWKELEEIDKESCLGKFFFFKPKAFENIDEYCNGKSVKTIFKTQQNGLKTDRDGLVFDFEQNVLEDRMRTFYSDEGLSPTFREKFNIEDSSSYNLLTRRQNTSFDSANIRPCLYRPFDTRWLYYALGLTSRPAWEVMRHMLAGANIGLIATRQTSDKWDVLVTKDICGHKSCAAYDINSLFPLYVYPDCDNTDLFEADQTTGTSSGYRSNIDPMFITDLSAGLKMSFIAIGKGDLKKSFGPEDVFNYIYGVFGSSRGRVGGS